MLYIPKVGDYLEILTDEKVKDFVAINFKNGIECNFIQTKSLFLENISNKC